MGTEADVEEIIELPIIKPEKAPLALPEPKFEPAPSFVPFRKPAQVPVEIER